MFPFVPFIISVGTMCGITTVLAVLMIVAEAIIADYGEVTIKINQDREIKAEGGKSLLTTLKEEGIFIPSACGGRGSCGLCKVKVKSGTGDYLPTESAWITPEERKENVRLSCQVKVKQEMDIFIPKDLFNVKEYKTRVESIVDLTHDIKQITLKLVEPQEINFTSGQFIQFEAPEYELSAEPVYRAYSISCPESSHDKIELEIRYVPNGICTTYVFKYLKEGDPVTINGPHGDFHLRNTDRDIVFIAGGSGMAPIKSMLMNMREKKIHRKAYYFFGARSRRDLFLEELMRDIEKDLPDFKFIPALSQPLPEDKWEGETGLITDVVSRYISKGDNLEAYLCGSPGMIDACVKVLTQKGVPVDLIFYDKFA